MTAPLAPRVDYPGEGLDESDLVATPFAQASRWIEDAVARSAHGPGVPEPTALSVATVDADGLPDVRVVLMRFFDPSGPGFVTHLDSAKARQLRDNPGVAAALTWPSLYRAIRFRGHARLLPTDAVAAYFTSRPWGSRISAWASEQSAPIAGRAPLEAASMGVPHAKTGEAAKLFVDRLPGAGVTEAEVIAHCRAGMTGYKVPSVVRFVDALPKSNVGKILRRGLRNVA